MTQSIPEAEALEKISGAVASILEALGKGFGLDVSDPNFKDTPQRVAKAYAEIFSGLRDTKAQLRAVLSKSFPCQYGGMVVVRDIRVFSMCNHHLLPVEYRVDLAYVPADKGHVIGISKLPRIVEILSKRPVLQEQLTRDITNTLMDIEGTTGAACIVRGRHFCMIMRGVCKPDAVVTTSSLQGIFEEEAVRAEFLQLVRTSNVLA